MGLRTGKTASGRCSLGSFLFRVCSGGHSAQASADASLIAGGDAMQSNQAHAISVPWTEPGNGTRVRNRFALDQEMVERGAEALFQFVFSGTERLDGKHLWANCDEKIKAGFRAEARAVLEAVWSRFAA